MSERLDRFAVFGFGSTHDALRAENVLLAADFDVALIPTPRALGTLCGFSVRVPLERQDAAAAVFSEAGIDPSGVIETEDRVSR